MLIQKAFQDDRQRRITFTHDLQSQRKCPLGTVQTFFLISLVLLVFLLGGVSAFLMLKGCDNKDHKNS